METIAIAPISTTAHTAEEELRFAELVARAGLEPELDVRFTADPVAVLSEFGLAAAEPVYFAALYSDAPASLVIEDLDELSAGRPGDTMVAGVCVCWTDFEADGR
ncbi:MAG: hypothetical protein QOF84_4362 [Streptomyces sp.]|jgi:hypothetical protein|nr:hypothetical protein [Streptomyces sp.]MDX6349572.1 hypothetical protein [Streptomyces sp.]